MIRPPSFTRFPRVSTLYTHYPAYPEPFDFHLQIPKEERLKREAGNLSWIVDHSVQEKIQKIQPYPHSHCRCRNAAGRKEGRKEGSRPFGLLLILSEVSFSGSDPAWVGVKFLSIGSYVSRKDKKIKRVRKKDSKAC